MSSSLGFEKALYLREATTYNEQLDMSVPGRALLPVRGDARFHKTINRIATEHGRQTLHTQDVEDSQGLVDITGDFGGVIPARADGFGILLKHLTGDVARSGVGPYTHTYSYGEFLFPGFSMAENRAGATYVYHGLQIEKFSVTFKVGGPIEYRCTVAGASGLDPLPEITLPSVTLLSSEPYYLTEHIDFEIDTVSEAITEMTIDWNVELLKSEDQSYKVGSDTRVSLARGGLMVSGSVTRRHDRDGSGGQQSKFWEKFISGATAALLVNIDHPTDGANHNMEFNFGHVKLTDADAQSDGKGHHMETVPFTCFNLDDSASNIVRVSQDANPTAASGTYDGTGT